MDQQTAATRVLIVTSGKEHEGNGWRCLATWHLPGSSATGSAISQLDVTPDRRYATDGDGAQEVNGFF